MYSQEFKLCAIVVTYYPDVEDTTENIMRYLPWVDKLIIWENTPKKDIDNYKIILNDCSKVIFYGIGENVGISKALNWAVNYAINNGYTHLLTMDQDSVWSDFNNYRNRIEILEGKLSYYVPLVNGKINSKNNVHITSGMIVPTEIYKKVGRYCEDFKIDVVDYEFCIRCWTYGILPTIIKEANLMQKFGDAKIEKVLGHQIVFSNYSSDRLFEIIKNYTILIRTYKIPFSEKWGLIKFWLIKIPLKIFLLDKNRILKYKAIISGLFAGFRNPKLKN